MLYGYKKSDALLIKNTIDGIFNTHILLVSGSDRESDVIEEIISDTVYDKFEDKEPKVLMFLGFDKNQINLTLTGFPGVEQVPRPIFCTLTESNVNWPLNQLLQHLVEERNYWKNKHNKEQ